VAYLFFLFILSTACSFNLWEQNQGPKVVFDEVSQATTPEEAVQILAATQARVQRSNISIFQSEINTTNALVFHSAYQAPDDQTGMHGDELLCVSRLHLLTDGWTNNSRTSSNCFGAKLPAQQGVRCAYSHAEDIGGYILFGYIEDDTLTAMEITFETGKTVRYERTRAYFMFQLNSGRSFLMKGTSITLHFEEKEMQIIEDIGKLCYYGSSIDYRR
jgi:hypothetical protein